MCIDQKRLKKGEGFYISHKGYSKFIIFDDPAHDILHERKITIYSNLFSSWSRDVILLYAQAFVTKIINNHKGWIGKVQIETFAEKDSIKDSKFSLYDENCLAQLKSITLTLKFNNHMALMNIHDIYWDIIDDLVLFE